MKEKFLINKWEYEIHDIMRPGDYGFGLDIYKNNTMIFSRQGFGNISGAKNYARDYFLLNEFGIEKENDND